MGGGVIFLCCCCWSSRCVSKYGERGEEKDGESSSKSQQRRGEGSLQQSKRMWERWIEQEASTILFFSLNFGIKTLWHRNAKRKPGCKCDGFCQDHSSLFFDWPCSYAFNSRLVHRDKPSEAFSTIYLCASKTSLEKWLYDSLLLKIQAQSFLQQNCSSTVRCHIASLMCGCSSDHVDGTEYMSPFQLFRPFLLPSVKSFSLKSFSPLCIYCINYYS